MSIIEIVSVGDELGFCLPKELLDAHSLAEGDTLYAIEAGDGFILTPCLPDQSPSAS